MKILIIDGYVDEPTCLGVPFNISTYPRYVAGAARVAEAKKIDYLTIEQLRNKNYRIDNYDLAIIIAGNPVPGKYLGGLPIKLYEFSEIAKNNPSLEFIVGGPISYENINFANTNIRIVNGDIEMVAYNYFTNSNAKNNTRNIDSLNRFAIEGAFIVEQHPRFPDLIIEIETGRGCPRKQHCSFCVEGLFPIDYREPKDIIDEMAKFSQIGIKHFRMAKQADLYTYGSSLSVWKQGFPQPNTAKIQELFSEIRNKISDIQTLHIDNVNPGTIARFPDETYKITQTIAKYNTPGDVAAFGMESADPTVIQANNLKATPLQMKEAIAMINDVGSAREQGIPKLLPGINIIKGLTAESRDTFRLNYEFLLDVLQSDLLLRRINIRQITLTPTTPIFNSSRPDKKQQKKLDAIFKNYRKKIRDHIDLPMLKKVFPVGTVFHNTIVEQNRGDWSLARNIGTYPIVINIPKIFTPLSKLSVFVIGHRERSLVGLPYPLDLRTVSLSELKQIPGLRKKAGVLMTKETLRKSDLAESTIFEKIKEYLL